MAEQADLSADVSLAARIPSVIKQEGQPVTSTQYVHISLGAESPAQPMTGIFIPANYQPQPKVDVILYLHGFHEGQPDLSIDGYWNTPSVFAFREGVNTSKKNVILVAPTLGRESQTGWLTGASGLDRYLDLVMAALNANGPYKGQSPTVGKIILSCHSGGGLPMRALALSKQRSTPLIRECWGFDCTYNQGDATLWAQWARSRPDGKLYIYYQRNTGTAFQAEALQSQNIRNVSVVPAHVIGHQPDPPYSDPHYWVPITYWASRVKGAAFLGDSGMVAPQVPDSGLGDGSSTAPTNTPAPPTPTDPSAPMNTSLGDSGNGNLSFWQRLLNAVRSLLHFTPLAT